MPVLNNSQHERFAVLVASGLSPTKAYIQAGFSGRHAHANAQRLMKNEDIATRIAEANTEVTKRTMAQMVSRRIADVNARFKEWQERWDEIREAIDTIVAERGEQLGGLPDDAPQDANDLSQVYYEAGTSTGFLAREYKGTDADVEVYRIDSGLINLHRLLLDYGERAAQELGHWRGKKPLTLEDTGAKSKYDIKLLTPDELDTLYRLAMKTKKPDTVQ